MRTLKISPTSQFLPREIYILAGESDMSGRGVLSEIPAFDQSSRIKLFTNSWVWADGYEPTDDASGQVDSVSDDGSAAQASCGMSFANRLAALRPGREIALVPCAKGGSKMIQWSKNLSRSTLYGSMIARAKEARNEGVIKGVVWWQGKNDYGVLADAEAWGGRCEQLIEDIRSDLEIPSLPVVIAVIDDQIGVASKPYLSTVQSQQRGVVGVNIDHVETNGLTMKVGDPVHLGTAGLISAGILFANAMDGML